MINTNHLRRGNLVGFKVKDTIHPCPVKIIYDAEVVVEYNRLPLILAMDTMQPILLTEEWLYNLQFEKRGYAVGAGGYGMYVNGHFTIMPMLGELKYLQVPNHITLKWVHQLQNLFFETQQEELTIK